MIACSLDIETSGFDANFNIILCAVIKPFTIDGNGNHEIFRADEYPNWDNVRSCDSLICRDIHKALRKYDIIVAHNGVKFDVPFLMTRFSKWGIEWQQPKIVDPVKLARRYMRFGRNTLQQVCHHFGISGKTECLGDEWMEAKFDRGRTNKKAMNYVVEHCVTPDHKTLTKDLKWVQIGSLRIGDELIGFDESGNGLSGRRYKTSVVESINFCKKPVFSVEISNGDVIKTTSEHKWLIGTNSCRGWNWVETRRLRERNSTKTFSSKVSKIFPVFEKATDYDSGWLGGILDGEGTIGTNHQISVAQRPGIVLDKIMNLLFERGNEFGLRLVDDCPGSGIGKKDCMNIHIRGNLPDRLSLLGTLRPERLISKIRPDDFGRMERRNEIHEVVSVNYIGDKEIAEVQTSSRTLFVDGYPMHNCIADVDILEKLTQKIKYLSPKINTFGSDT